MPIIGPTGDDVNLVRVGDPTVLTLPIDLIWIDEFEWQPVEARMSRSVAGALLVDRGVKIAGRPMTLVGSDNHGWVTRDTLDALYAWAALPDAEFTLQYRNALHSVIFDHSRIAVEGRPVFEFPIYVDADHFIPTLRFLTKT